MTFTQLAKGWLRAFGLVIQRWPASRFEATSTALDLLHRAGFRPDVIIDVGANRGQWTTMTREIYPDATYHLVEPQRGCQPSLDALARGSSRIHIHATAVTRPGVSSVLMIGGGADHAGTGSFIPAGNMATAATAPHQPATYPSTTLDALFGDVTARRLLLKLDVEGHELAVLEGARALLRRTEVIVSEFWMFQLADEQMATLPQLIAWLEREGFVLYDFGALHGRPSDNRLTSGDAIFVRNDSSLVQNSSWQ